jgi:hypothetical protein
MFLRLLACLLVVVAVQCTPALFASSPPFAPGATWTYRYTVTRPSEAPAVGTLTTRYEGPATYRGRQCYVTEVSDTITPNVTEKDYYEWTGAEFRQIAIQTATADTTLEIVFDKTVPLDTEQSASGTAETYFNGADQGPIPWHTAVRSLGADTVSVPAGTFYNVHRWQTTFQFGAIQQVQTAAVVGLVDLRVDSEYYVNGALRSSASEELISGPVQ